MTILVEVAIKSFVVLAAAFLLSLALRRRSASTRHLMWSLAVISVVSMPLLVAVAPPRAVQVAEDSPLGMLVAGYSMPRTMDEAGAQRSSLADSDPGSAQPTVAVTPGGGSRASAAHGMGSAAQDTASAATDTTVSASDDGDSVPNARGSAAHDTAAAGRAPAGAGSPVAAPAPRDDVAQRGSVPAGRVLLLGLWLAVGALVLATVTVERVRLAAMARRARPCSDGVLARDFARICREAGLRRRPTLRLGPTDAMPMTWGSVRPLVLLPAAAESWSPARRDTVLRHEIAHVRRYDDALQLLATLMVALHWFDPLAWVALFRLRVEREHACDDAVLRGGARPSAYAEALLHIADGFRSPASRNLAALSMARPSHLGKRIVAVLEESRDRRALSLRRVTAGIAIAVLLAVPVAALGVAVAPAAAGGSNSAAAGEPGNAAAGEPNAAAAGELNPAALPALAAAPQVSECWAPGVDRSSRSMSDSDHALRILEWESDGCRATLRVEGELSFNEDFTAIVGLSPGGSFRLTLDEDGTERRLEIDERGGELVRRWSVDGRERPFDAEAQRWFSALLVSILRSSGIAAEERAAWIYRNQGSDGVLREVEMIAGNSSKGRYLIALMGMERLPDADLLRALTLVDGIDSNSVKTRVLEAIGTGYPDRILGGGIEEAYWRSVAGVESASNTSRLLSALIEGQPQDAALVIRAISEAGELIDSNSTLASFLRRLQRAYPDIATSGPQATLFWQTLARVDSNSTTRALLLDLGEGAPIDSELLPVIFDAAQTLIDSNSTLAEFVLTIEQRYPDIGESGPMADEFWATVDRIDSNSTISRLLLELAAGKPDGSPMLDRVLATADRKITSSSNRRDFIVSFAGAHRDAATGRLREAVLQFARDIGSRSARQRALDDLDALGIG